MINIQSYNNLNYLFKTDKSEYINQFYPYSNENIIISIFITNIGENQWTNNTKLKCSEKSQLKCNEIKLKNLKENETQNVKCTFETLENIFVLGTYTIYLDFSVDNMIYGKPIKIILKCVEQNN